MATIALDIETNRLEAYHEDAEILSVAVWSPSTGGEAWLATDERKMEDLRDILLNPRVTVVGHNIALFDLWWLERVLDIEVQCLWFDTQVAFSQVNENEPNSLRDLAIRYGIPEELIPSKETKAQRKKMAAWPTEDLLAYNLQDAELSYLVYEHVEKELASRPETTPDQTNRLMWFLRDSARVLIDIQHRGIAVDPEWAESHGAVLETDLIRHNEDAVADYQRFADGDINIRSTKQLQKFLFGLLGLPVIETTKSGAPSTSAYCLKKLRLKAQNQGGIVWDTADSFLSNVLSYREKSKILNTYLRPLVNEHLGGDGRVHPTYRLSRSAIGGTVTGRLASANPNAQNQPNENSVLGCFVAGEGLRICYADYSQLEMRVGGWYAQDEELLRAFHEDLDVHTAAMAGVLGIPYDEAVAGVLSGELKDERALIKPINFGIFYGAGAHRLVKLAEDIGKFMTMAEAEAMIEAWFSHYSGVYRLIQDTYSITRTKGYVVSPTGRVRRLVDARYFGVKGKHGLAMRALRQSVNFLVQSLASDIMLLALGLMNEDLGKQGGAQIIQTVHDSVSVEYDPRDWGHNEIAEYVSHSMVAATTQELETRFGITGIPLKVDVETDITRRQK